MMANTISFPFRITKYGEAAKVVQGTDEYYSEQIATILLTIQGERGLEPLLGIPDIAFDGFQNSALQSQVATYLPDLKNVEGRITKIGVDKQSVTVSFETGAEG